MIIVLFFLLFILFLLSFILLLVQRMQRNNQAVLKGSKDHINIDLTLLHRVPVRLD